MGTRGLSVVQCAQIDRIHADAELFHDETQLRYFILGQSGYGSAFGVVKQVHREVESRTASLNRMDRDAECRRAELAYAHVRANRWAFTARAKCERAKAQQEVLQLREAEETYQRQRRHLVREIEVLLDAYTGAQSELGDITPERRKELELEYWATRLSKQVRLSMVAEGRLDAALLETISSLPEEAYVRVLAAVDHEETREALAHKLADVRDSHTRVHGLVAPEQSKELPSAD